jgi:hypothetical protein
VFRHASRPAHSAATFRYDGSVEMDAWLHDWSSR